jgi:hypothetical protein
MPHPPSRVVSVFRSTDMECRRAPTWLAAGHTVDTVLRLRAGVQEQARQSHCGRRPGKSVRAMSRLVASKR